MAFFGSCYLCLAVVPDSNSTLWLVSSCHSVLVVRTLSVLEDRSDWLTREELAPLVRERPGGSLLAGFDRRAGDAPSSGARLSADTFGHLGFTGTSLWIDPRAKIGRAHV